MIRSRLAAVVATALILVPAAASAEPQLNFEPVAREGAAIRYNQGAVTQDLRLEHGAVQITPLGLDHGRLTFDVAVLNTGPATDDFGVEDVSVAFGDQQVAVLSRQQLEKMAKNRAFWGTMAVALATGLAAASAANQRDTYTATTFTRHGTYRIYISGPSAAGQIQAAAITAGGAYTVARIQDRLDRTRAALAHEIVQTTTIDPDDSYAGRIVVEKPKGKTAKWPQAVALNISFNGEQYPFVFNVTKAK